MARSPFWRFAAWRVLRVTIAVVLLAYDVRWFALYAFLLLLRVLDAVDYVRAVARTYQTTNDMRWLTLMRRLDITHGDLGRTMQEVRAAADERHLKSLARDWALVYGRGVTLDELFDHAPHGTTVLRPDTISKEERDARAQRRRTLGVQDVEPS